MKQDWNHSKILKRSAHCVYRNKIALSASNDRRIQTFYGIILCPYDTSAGRV